MSAVVTTYYMLSKLILTLVRAHSSAPPLTPSTLTSNHYQAARNALMQSLFHAQGPPSFKKGRTAK